ncbi:MAG TPA: hypothetical protein V6D00_12370 [Pantanalinema sp.]
MNISFRNIKNLVPNALSNDKAPALETGETRVAKEREYKAKLDKVRVAAETPDLLVGPGIPLGVLDKSSRLSEYRARYDRPIEAGVRFDGTADPKVENVERPGGTADASARWDPLEFAPRFIFQPGEDSLPVSPSFDGDANLENDAPGKLGGKDGAYKDGVIGNKQALSGGFAVTKKGEYTILSYSFYYPTNKAGDYHNKDWSHAQVYLKPDKNGELKPEYLYTSWHHGGVLTRWDDLKKDEQGKPIVQVCLGSHAASPLGKNESIPTKGLQIRGDGQAEFNGKTVPHTLTWDAFQSNVTNARHLEEGSIPFKARAIIMQRGAVAFDPIMPEAFLKEGGFGKAVAEKAEPYVDKALDKVKDVGRDLMGFFVGLFN